MINTDLNDKTPLVLLTEELNKETALQKLCYLPQKFVSTLVGKLYEKRDKYVPAFVGKACIVNQYHREIKYIRKHPINRNNAWDFRYLYGSLNLYSAHIEEDEYIINNPNSEIIITLININLSIFFSISLITLLIKL